MDATTAYYLRLLSDWIPFLVFVGLLIYFVRRMKKTQEFHFESVRQYHSEHLAETRKIAASLERIAGQLEQRADR
jgi:ATP-dependent Zn protease